MRVCECARTGEGRGHTVDPTHSGGTILSYHKLKQGPTSRRRSERGSSRLLCPHTRPAALVWYNRRTRLGAGYAHLKGRQEQRRRSARHQAPPTPVLPGAPPASRLLTVQCPRLHSPVPSCHLLSPAQSPHFTYSSEALSAPSR